MCACVSDIRCIQQTVKKSEYASVRVGECVREKADKVEYVSYGAVEMNVHQTDFVVASRYTHTHQR